MSRWKDRQKSREREEHGGSVLSTGGDARAMRASEHSVCYNNTTQRPIQNQRESARVVTVRGTTEGTNSPLRTMYPAEGQIPAGTDLRAAPDGAQHHVGKCLGYFISMFGICDENMATREVGNMGS